MLSGGASNLDPFAVEDFDGVCLPQVPLSLHLPGMAGQAERSCERLYSAGLLAEAASAFQFRLFCQSLAASFPAGHRGKGSTLTSIKILHQIAHTTYKLAACQYELGRFEAAARSLRSLLAGQTAMAALGISALAARLSTLLMCSEFRQGRLDQVRALSPSLF